MQFIVNAADHPDALERRLAVRADHIALGDRLRDEGRLLYAAAHLDESGQMCGSLLVFDVEDRAALDRLLEKEPYITGNVWGKITISPCRVGPSFAGKQP